MTDIFLSYSARDRARVQPIHDALAAHGFDVFWDQLVPTGTDWDSWIRRHLGEAKCAIVAWSVHSAASDNVRHEATMAKQQDKLVPVLLDPLGADQFPMGLYAVQGANLAAWTGSLDDPEWQKLLHAAQHKLTPGWIRQVMDRVDAELVAERARREIAERRDRTLRDQIVKEAQASQELRRELDDAREEATALNARLAASAASQAEIERRLAERSEQLSELDTVRKDAAALKARLETAIAERDVHERHLVELAAALRGLEAQHKQLAEKNDNAERIIATLRQRLADVAPPAQPRVSQNVSEPSAPPAGAKPASPLISTAPTSEPTAAPVLEPTAAPLPPRPTPQPSGLSRAYVWLVAPQLSGLSRAYVWLVVAAVVAAIFVIFMPNGR